MYTCMHVHTIHTVQIINKFNATRVSHTCGTHVIWTREHLAMHRHACMLFMSLFMSMTVITYYGIKQLVML